MMLFDGFRVKGTDFHPIESWLLTGLYNGTVNIYNHETRANLRCPKYPTSPSAASSSPRAKTRKLGRLSLRVHNYNTHQKVISFEAHPTASIVSTGSDGMTLRAWDWVKQWKCIQLYEGHTHYLMPNATFNPKDANMSAPA